MSVKITTTGAMTSIFTDVITYSPIKIPRTMKLELTNDDVLCFIDKCHLLDSSDVDFLIINNNEQSGLQWSDCDIANFKNENNLAPDLVNMVINRKGLTVECAYLNDKSIPKGTFESCIIPLENIHHLLSNFTKESNIFGGEVDYML